MATQSDPDDKPKYVFEQSPEAKKFHQMATPEEKALLLAMQKIVFKGTGLFDEDEEDVGGD